MRVHRTNRSLILSRSLAIELEAKSVKAKSIFTFTDTDNYLFVAPEKKKIKGLNTIVYRNIL